MCDADLTVSISIYAYILFAPVPTCVEICICGNMYMDMCENIYICIYLVCPCANMCWRESNGCFSPPRVGGVEEESPDGCFPLLSARFPTAPTVAAAYNQASGVADRQMSSAFPTNNI